MDRKPMTRKQERAMFADMANKLKARGYSKLSQRHFESLKQLQKSMKMKGPLTVSSMDRLVKLLRNRFEVAGIPFPSGDDDEAPSGQWRYYGAGLTRFTIGDPSSKLAIKVTRKDAPRLGTSDNITGRRQVVLEAKKYKQFGGKHVFRTTVDKHRIFVGAPKIYAMGPTGRYSLVELVAGPKYGPSQKTRLLIRRKMKASDIGSENVRRSSKRVIKVVDLGVPSRYWGGPTGTLTRRILRRRHRGPTGHTTSRDVRL